MFVIVFMDLSQSSSYSTFDSFDPYSITSPYSEKRRTLVKIDTVYYTFLLPYRISFPRPNISPIFSSVKSNRPSLLLEFGDAKMDGKKCRLASFSVAWVMLLALVNHIYIFFFQPDDLRTNLAILQAEHILY